METKVIQSGKILLIENLLTQTECDEFIELMNIENTECIGVHAKSHRFCKRSVIKMEDLAKRLWCMEEGQVGHGGAMGHGTI